MIKVGCLGGSFDPIHKGHLELAKFALKNCDLDEVWLIPTKSTPLKDRQVSEINHRKAMIDLAIQGQERIMCCDIEENLEQPSYTIKTVETLKEKYPNHQFFWIIGDDLVKQLPLWKDIETLMKKIQFIVVQRNEESVEDSRFIYQKGFDYKASSTEIRCGDFKELTKEVKDYILDQGLYLNEIVQSHCSESRTSHVLTTTELALELAAAHQVDLKKVRLASMLHDICKEKSDEEIKSLLSKEEKKVIRKFPYRGHAYAGAAWARKYMGVEDEVVLNAIYAHSEGNAKSEIGKIIYLADKLDRGRGFNDERLIEQSKKDLNLGIEEVKSEYEKRRREHDLIKLDKRSNEQ